MKKKIIVTVDGIPVKFKMKDGTIILANPLCESYIYRSAKTGRIVTEKWALKHPATTTKEKISKYIKGYIKC